MNKNSLVEISGAQISRGYVMRIAWLAVILFSFGVIPQVNGQVYTNIYNTAGTNSFVIPAGVTQIVVQAWGGGGGARFSGVDPRAGGGGGAYAGSTVSVTAGQNFTIIVGSGGAPGNAGQNGGNSIVSIGSVTNVLAAGGGGATSGGAAGTGGAAASSIGSVRHSGGNGGNPGGNAGGGGGGSALTTGNGSNGGNGVSNTGGAGGSGTGNGGAGGNDKGSGQNGFAPGGGGGAMGKDGAASGSGASGRVIVVYEVGEIIEPAQLAFITSPQSINVGTTSSVITVELQSTNGMTAVATNNVTLNLSSSLSGSFRHLSTTNVLTSVVISNGQSSASFRFSSGTLGVHELIATNSGGAYGFASQYLVVSLPPVIYTNAYTTPGEHTFTVPAGVTQLYFQAWGGGGGSHTSGTAQRPGAGGGAYAASHLPVTPGDTYTIIVGAGGSAANPGQNGAPSIVIFNNTTNVLAAGGGGTPGTSTVGPGGTVANSIGQVRYAGGNGGNVGSSSGGGGGGSAFTNANGSNGATGSGSSGGSGGNGTGQGGNGGNSGQPGQSGQFPGGGGGGRGNNGGASGGGADGRVLMTFAVGDTTPVNLVFTTPEQTIYKGETSEVVTVELRTITDGLAVATNNILLELMALPGGGDFISFGGEEGIESVIISNGQSSVSFYFKSDMIGIYTLSVTDEIGPLGSVEQQTIVTRAPNVQTNIYASSGTYTFTVPLGVTQVFFEVWGGGGGSHNSGTARRPGAGGGAYAASYIATTPGETYTVIVGSGGSAGNPPQSGQPSLVVFEGATNVLAAGGGVPTTTTIGLGGTVAASIGQIRYAGGDGGQRSGTSGGGGGGGSAFTNANGSAGGNGSGSSGGAGGAGTGNGGNGGNNGQGGQSGQFPGGGGGGRGENGGSSGGGAGGQAILTYEVNDLTPFDFAFSTPERSFITGATSDVITIELRTVEDLTAVATNNVLFNLSTSLSGSFRDTNGAGPITSVIISNGSSSASFIFTSLQVGTHVITATNIGAGFGAQSQFLEVEPLPSGFTNQYDSPGTYTFTVPPGVTQVYFQAWGGGGGSHNSGTARRPGAGGGAYAGSYLAVTSGASFTIVVGSGGSAGNPPQSGQPSIIINGNVTNVLAAGGSAPGTTTIGPGGTVAASIGQVRYAGGNGGQRSSSSGGGGGGGSAFTNANGSAGGDGSGSTGGAGGSGTGFGGNGGNNGQPGLSGQFPGGGGGGRGDNGGSSGGGGNGLVVLEYEIADRTPAKLAFATPPRTMYRMRHSEEIAIELRAISDLPAIATNDVWVDLSSTLSGTFHDIHTLDEITHVIFSNGLTRASFLYYSAVVGERFIVATNTGGLYGQTNQLLIVAQEPIVVTNIYTVAGTNTFTVPSNATQVWFHAWGGGGGSHSGTGESERPGAGGGAYAGSLLQVNGDEVFTIVVGAGGTAGNPGQNGQPSMVILGNTTNVLAAGGGGTPSTTVPGSGGSAANSIGQTVFSGGNGGSRGNSGSGGGGGGSAFTNAMGGNGQNGFSFIGGAGGVGTGNGGDGGNTGAPGQNGFFPGGGGGGRGDGGITSGGGGTGQVVVIYELEPPNNIVFTTPEHTIIVNEMSPVISVELRTISNYESFATNNVTIELSSIPGGVFRDVDDTTDITSVVISNGFSSASFRYTSPFVGTNILTATNVVEGYGAAYQSLYVDPIPTVFTNVYGSVGTNTFVVPLNVTQIWVHAWGGGGGSHNSGTADRPGAGGGAYAGSYIDVQPGEVVTVIIGAGGAPAAPGQNGQPSLVIYDGVTNVLAAGGGGAPGTSTAGTGGAISDSIGQVRYAGGNGGARGSSGSGGGGGGSGFTNANGVAGSNGAGSTGGAGGAGTGFGGNGGNSGQPGQSGEFPGGGGGGRGNNGGASGGGGDGQIIIIYEIVDLGPPASFVFITPERLIYAGFTSAVLTVELRTTNNTQGTATNNISLELSTSMDGTFVSVDGSQIINSVIISNGESRASFRYTSSEIGAHLITVTNINDELGWDEQWLTVDPIPNVFTNEFNDPGSYTFTVPVGITQVYFQAWGGGGGANSGGTAQRPGGGGGAYAGSYLAVTSGATFTIIVGSGGSAGSPGQNGQPSMVVHGNTTNVLAAGGGGAPGISTVGPGGTIAASIGQVRHAGGNGGNTGTTSGGGGGGSGFTDANGNAGSNGSGSTGGAGGAGTGAGGDGGNNGQPGQSGTFPGGGGGGRGDNGGTSGDGGGGQVVITYEFTDLDPERVVFITPEYTILQGTTSDVITVSLITSNGAMAFATNDVTLGLSNDKGGVFRNADNTSNIVQVVIYNGQSTASFRFATTNVGVHVLSVDDLYGDLSTTNQNLYSDPPPAPVKISFATLPQLVFLGQTSSVIVLTLLDTNNLPARATNNMEIFLSSDLGGTFFDVLGVGGVGSVVVSNGQTSAAFLYTSTNLGVHIMVATNNTLTPASQPITIRVGVANITQIYYVPLEEADLQAFFRAITSSGIHGTNVTTIGISAFASNTIIVYDHWEDGYEFDLSNPTQATTEVWGDRNASNGCPPSVTVCTDANDVIEQGDIQFIVNAIPAWPRNPANIYYDGRDRFGVNRRVAVTRAGWDTGHGTLLAGAVEVYETSRWGQHYRMPVGTNVITGSQAFEYTQASIMAKLDGTVVVIDLNSDGIPNIVTNLNEGQSYRLTSGIRIGTTITSSAPVQVHLITGDIASTYECRWYSITPFEDWASEYYSPVGTVRTDGRYDTLIYNPNTNAISVGIEYLVGGVSVFTSRLVGANGVAIFTNSTLNTAQYYFNTNNQPFFVLGIIDQSGTGDLYDWGYSLIPRGLLSPVMLVGWAPGVTPGTTVNTNKHPVWVTPLANTTIYVDYNGNGGPFSSDCGSYDVSFNVNRLQILRLFDPDHDNTGMRIFTCDGTDLAAAWGQDPSRSFSGDGQAMDLGTTVLPLPAISARKAMNFAPGGDLNENNRYNPGEAIRYSIIITNPNLSASGTVTVRDMLPPQLIYIPNSTFVDGFIPVPDSGITPFPLDETGYLLGTVDPLSSRTITYEAYIQNPYTNSNLFVTNRAVVADDIATVVLIAEAILPVSLPALGVNLEKTVGLSGEPFPGGEMATGTNDTAITYWFVVTNDGEEPLDYVTLDDPWLSFTTNLGPLAVGQSVTTSFDTVITYTVTNVASAVGIFQGYYGVTNTDTASIILISPQFELRKTVSEQDQFLERANILVGTNGQDITYWFIVLNAGDVALTNVILNDYDIGFSTNIGTIVPWHSVTLGVDRVINGSFTNTAVIEGWDTLGNFLSYSNTAQVVEINPSITLAKTVSGDGSYPGGASVQHTNGAPITYWLVVSNSGDVVLYDVYLRDEALDFEFDVGTLPPGSFEIIDIDTYITAHLTNFAIVSGLDEIGNTHSAEASAEVIMIYPSIAVSKTVSLEGMCPGMELVAGMAGTPIQFCIIVTNDGNLALTNVVLNDAALSVNTNLGGLAVGQAVTVVVATTISATMTNVATASGWDVLFNQQHWGDDSAVVVELMRLSGHVIFDENANGIRDVGETNGITNVVVTLYDTDTNVVQIVTTDATGFFTFTNVAVGSYIIEETDPPGYVSTGDSVPPNDNLIPISVVDGISVTNLYFLDTDLASISGQVREDQDADGNPDDSDPGLPGVTLLLYTDPNGDEDWSDGVVVATNVTDAFGFFNFTLVEPGSYVIVKIDPPGFFGTYESDGDVDGEMAIFMPGGFHSTGNIFLVTAPADIGGQVRNDLDGNGDLSDPDPGLPGVTIRLFTDPNRDGDISDGVAIATNVTDSGGFYAFTNVTPGYYVIVATDLPGFKSSGDRDGGDFNQIILSPHRSSVATNGNDFLDTVRADIFGQVRNDIDGDGDFNDPDFGIRDVHIALYTDPNGDGDPSDGVLVATNITDELGFFVFRAVNTGNFVIVETDPPGYYSSADTDPPNDNRIRVTMPGGIDSSGHYFLDVPTRLFKRTSHEGAHRGDTITYTLVPFYAGIHPMTNAVLTDPVPSGTVYVAGSATSGGTYSNGVVTWRLGSTTPADFADTTTYGTTTLVAVADTWISSADPTDNNGTSIRLDTRPSSGPRHAMVSFDMSQLPAGASVSSAWLRLQVVDTRNNHTVTVRRALTTWTELGATWNRPLVGGNWGGGGSFSAADYSTNILASINMSNSGVVTNNITSLVQDWVSGGVSNQGIILYAIGPDTSNARFYSREESTASRRPQLIVNWVLEGNRNMIDVAPTLMSATSEVQVTMRLRSPSLVTNVIAPTSLIVNATSGATVELLLGPLPPNSDVWTNETPFVYVYRVSGGTTTGNVSFSGAPVNYADQFPPATSLGMVVAPPLQFSATLLTNSIMTAVTNIGSLFETNFIPVTNSNPVITFLRGSIAGEVRNDLHARGDINETNPPLTNVVLQLYTDPNGDGDPSDGVLYGTTTTDTNGYYRFSYVPTGRYVVVEIDPVGAISTADSDGDNDNRIAVHLSDFVLMEGHIFLDTFPVTVSGQVRHDIDGDGDLLAPDPGVSNVVIYLYTDPNGDGNPEDGVVIATNITDSSGNYQFENVIPGSYVLVQEDPPGYHATADSDGGVLNQVAVSPVSRINTGGHDFLISQVASIFGFVLEDMDGNGNVLDADPGITNVMVVLYTDPDGDGDPTDGIAIATNFTGSTGEFFFINVVTGNFVLVQTDLEGFFSTGDSDGDNDNRIRVFMPGSVSSFSNVFLDARPSGIYGFSYEDPSGDGDINNPGDPLIDAFIELFSDPNGDGDPADGVLIGSYTTDEFGDFAFTNLMPGRYVLVETDPYGYGSTADSEGPNDNRIPLQLLSGTPSLSNIFLNARYVGVSISKTPSIEGVLGLGDIVTYTVTISNTGVVPHSGTTLTDQFPEEMFYVPGSTRIYTRAFHVRDEFNGIAYTNNNGSGVWASSWIEVGDSTTDPQSGMIQIVDEQLRLSGDNRSVSRSVNADGYARALLTFDYRVESFDNADDWVRLLASPDGSSWTTLHQWTGPLALATGTLSFNVTPYISAETTIRFQTSPGMDNTDFAYFDNIEMDIMNVHTGGAPPLMMQDYVLGPRQNIIVTYDAIAEQIAIVFNEACVTTVYEVFPFCSSASNEVIQILMTQGMVVVRDTNEAWRLEWSATDEPITRDYDLIYVDTLTPGFSPALSPSWDLAARVKDRYFEDAGSPTHPSAWELGENIRFYRAAHKDRWRTNNVIRNASKQVYTAKSIQLKEGENWVSLFMQPDSCCPSAVFGTNMLPAGPTMNESTIIQWYGATLTGQATNSIWLDSETQTWRYHHGGSANYMPLPLNEGFNIILPAGSGPRPLPVIGQMPTNTAVELGTVMTLKGSSNFNVVSYNLPYRATLAQSGLREAGFRGPNPGQALNPLFSDEIRILQKGGGSLASPQVRIIMNSSSNFVFWTGGSGSAENYRFNVDDAIIIQVRRSTNNLQWTIPLPYPAPTIYIDP